MKFKVREFIKRYTRVDDEYKHIEVEKMYSVETWDDLQTLLMNLVDFSESPVKFEVSKEEKEEK